MEPLSYGVIGFGPVGRVVAAHLAQAKFRVSVLTHCSSDLEILKSTPLVIKGAANATAQLTHCYSKLSEFIESKPDVIYICTKSTDSRVLLENIFKLNPPQKTLFVSCQNGLDVEEQIRDVFGRKRALRQVLNMGCSISGPNEVTVNFFMQHYISDLPLGAIYAQQIANDLSSARFPTQVKTDYRVEIFKKAILNSSLGTLCAVTRQTMSHVMQRPDMVSLVKQVVVEGIAIAHAMDIAIHGDFVEQAMIYLNNGGDHKPSILVDVEKKRKTENEYLCGKLNEYAQTYGVKCTLIPILSALIKTIESKYDA